jgi:hypothetical protein
MKWFLLFLFLVSSETAAASDEYVRIRTAIGKIESGNDPAAKNPVTSASGKYQFMKSWNPWFVRNAGTSWTAVVPKRTAPRPVKLEMGKKQDVLFDRYYQRVVAPWIRYMRAEKLGLKLTDGEMVALVHRQGTGWAERYLRSGVDPFAGKKGNKHISSHLRNFRQAMQYTANVRG